MEHDDVTLTGLVTMQPSTHLSVLWGVIKCRCHGDRPLAMKHDVAVSPMETVRSSPKLSLYITGPALNSSTSIMGFLQMPLPWQHNARHEIRFSHNFSENVPNGPKLHRFGNDAAINASKRIMGCHQMPLAWRQIIRHQVSSKVCSSNILLLFQAFLLSFLLSSHIQAPSVHVSFQSKFFTFFLHITFQHSSLASDFQHKAFPLAISSGIAFSSSKCKWFEPPSPTSEC